MHNELAKSKKKPSKEKQVVVTPYSIQKSKYYSSYMDQIMDLGASNHMTSNASIFSSYDKKRKLAQNVENSNKKC